MDIPVHRPRGFLRRHQVALIVASIAATTLVLATLGIRGLRAGVPRVPRASVWMGTVERGEMLREVQGNGKLVPEHMQWITALSAARVERIFVLPGATVQPDTVLLELGNPDLELAALEAEREVAAAKAELADLRASLRGEKLAQEATVSTLRIDADNARRRADTAAELGERGFASADEQKDTAATQSSLEQRVALEQRRLAVLDQGMSGRLAAQTAQIDRLEKIVAFRHAQLAALRVKAGVAGVLQELPLEAGQWVNPGGLLAKVAKPDRLKAQIAIPETLARDLAVGQKAHIDTRNGIIDGTVSRVDPAASAGTVTIDVALAGELPRGARPDLGVIGTIEIERLPDVLHVGRPAFVQANSPASVFKVIGDRATRIAVSFGRASTTRIEVTAGLSAGDRIILSDLSQWDGKDNLQLE